MTTKTTTNEMRRLIGYRVEADGTITVLRVKTEQPTKLTLDEFLSYMRDTLNQDIRIAAFMNENQDVTVKFSANEIEKILAL